MHTQTTPADLFPAYSDSICHVAAALAKAQAIFPEVHKNKKARIPTKGGSVYEFRYADLNTILTACRGALTENELTISQLIRTIGPSMVLQTLLIHSSGEFLSSTLPLNNSSGAQALGSEITYMKRYALSSMLGIAADDDDDGNLAEASKKDKPQQAASNARRPAPTAPNVPTIPVSLKEDGSSDWETFAQTFKAEVEKINDLDALNAFMRAHNGAISNLGKHAPNLHTDIAAFTKDRRSFLAQAPIDQKAG